MKEEALNMRRKILAFFSALLFFTLEAGYCLSVTAENHLYHIFNAGKTLLFDIENVTVSGHADFHLDGVLFKTADILYKQDSNYSHWQLDLITPRPGRENQKSGYTIIANGEKIYIMEAYTPGIYSIAYDQPCTALVRRSVSSDLVVSMAYAMADPIEALLPENAFSVSDTREGTEIQFTVTQETAPGLLNPLLNLVLQFGLRRFLGVDPDRISDWETGSFENYLTATEGIIHTTSSYLLGNTSVTVGMDTKGRLTSIRGNVCMILDSLKEPERTLTVTFDVSVSDYGTTYVRTFDADEFGVIPAV